MGKPTVAEDNLEKTFNKLLTKKEFFAYMNKVMIEVLKLRIVILEQSAGPPLLNHICLLYSSSSCHN